MAKARRLVELCAIVALALFCIASSLPGFRILGRPIGTYGMSWDIRPLAGGGNAPTVVKVAPGSPADRAGVLPGDHLPANASLLERIEVTHIALPGETRTYDLERDGTPRPVTLAAASGNVYFADDTFNRVYMAIRIPSALLLAIVSIALVLRAPSKMTWGLALFLLSLTPGTVAIRAFNPMLPAIGAQFFGATYGGLDVIGHFGALIFALRFPRDEVRGFAAAVDRWAWPFAIALMLLRWIGSRIVSLYLPSGAFDHVFVAVDRFVQLLPWVAAAILMHTLLSAKGVERRRLQWVIIGVVIGCIVQPFNSWSNNLSAINSTYAARALGLFTGVVPFFVAYGVLRHRILDVGFVLNRAAVYTAVTALLVGVLGIVKLLAGWYLKENWQVVVQAATAIGLGLSTQRIYKAADWLVDRYIFPHAHATQERLKRLGDGLKYARNTDSVALAVTSEAAEALNLGSCALFRRRADGSYVRRAAVGWGGDDLSTIAASDPLPIYLEGDASHFDVRDVLKGKAGYPPGAAAPQHAYPLMAARALVGFALYSDHADGTALDPDEIGMLDKLTKSAGDAYDPLLRVKQALREASPRPQT